MEHDSKTVGIAGLARADAAGMPMISYRNILITHIRIDSAKAYSEVAASMEKLPKFDYQLRALLQAGDTARVKRDLERLQGSAGLVVFSVATHGDWLQIRSGKRNAAQYVIGNVLISTQMTARRLEAGLYAPLRVMLFENENGTASLEYDQPSTLFGQYGDELVTTIARDLDKKIYDALVEATR